MAVEEGLFISLVINEAAIAAICFLYASFLHKSLDLKRCCNLFVVVAISHTQPDPTIFPLDFCFSLEAANRITLDFSLVLYFIYFCCFSACGSGFSRLVEVAFIFLFCRLLCLPWHLEVM